MQLVTYNIQYGFGLDGAYDLERIAAAVAAADIIAFQEVTRNYPTNGNVDMVADLAALLPEHFHVFGAALDVDAGSRVEAGRAVNRRFEFGNAVFSRFPIISSRNHLLPRSLTFDALNLQRGAIEALIATPHGPLRVYSVHLDHISGAERAEQVRALKQIALSFPQTGGAVSGARGLGFEDPPVTGDFVLMGDFNMSPETPEYIAMVGEADPLFGRALRATEPADALARLGVPDEDTWSWTDPNEPSRRDYLDHCFVNAGLVPHLASARIDTEATGSDHMPVWLELSGVGTDGEG